MTWHAQVGGGGDTGLIQEKGFNGSSFGDGEGVGNYSMGVVSEANIEVSEGVLG